MGHTDCEFAGQPASNTEDRRRRAISVPPETEAPEPKESKSPRYRKPVPSFGHSERQGTPTSTFDEPEPPSTSRNPKRTLDQDVAVPLHTKKSAVSSLSIAVPVADAQQPPNKGRRSASGGNRRISLQDRPTPVPTPPPKDDHDQTEMIKLRQALRQAQQENDLLKSQQKQLDEEVQTAFDVSGLSLTGLLG